MESEAYEKDLVEWLRIMVFDDELTQILLHNDNLDSTLNVYKKRQEGWKKKL